ncbi:hypothetical protein BGX38DRAFT_1200960 [Terfezia claveryi]|nr:hypothetical protein BGX38DRAFT_1200960 [Terfezia claveryi]
MSALLLYWLIYVNGLLYYTRGHGHVLRTVAVVPVLGSISPRASGGLVRIYCSLIHLRASCWLYVRLMIPRAFRFRTSQNPSG